MEAKILSFTSQLSNAADIAVMVDGTTLWNTKNLTRSSREAAICDLSTGLNRPPKEGRPLSMRVGVQGGGTQDFYFDQEIFYSPTGKTQKFAIQGTVKTWRLAPVK
jgi:hypothetical protein